MNSLYGSLRARGAVFKVRGREAAPLLLKWGGGGGGGGGAKTGLHQNLNIKSMQRNKKKFKLIRRKRNATKTWCRIDII